MRPSDAGARTVKLEQQTAGPHRVLVFRYIKETDGIAQSSEPASGLGLDVELIRAAARKGNTQALQWATTAAYCLSMQREPEIVSVAFYDACAHGRLPAAWWLARQFGLAAHRDVVVRALRRACTGGHLGVVSWMNSELRLTMGEVRDKDVAPLFAACEGGHSTLIGWLVSAYRLTAADVRARGSRALEALCRRGSWYVADWLVANFGLTAGDARAGLRGAFMGAQTGTMQWIVALLDAREGLRARLGRPPSPGATPVAPPPPNVDRSIYASGALWAALLAGEPEYVPL